jgi:hypothetical protein
MRFLGVWIDAGLNWRGHIGQVGTKVRQLLGVLGRISADLDEHFLLSLYTLKPRYNDPFNKKILAIKNLISSSSVVNFIVKSPCNNKTPAIKNKFIDPFRFVIPRFLCNSMVLPHLQYCLMVCGDFEAGRNRAYGETLLKLQKRFVGLICGSPVC